MNQMIDEAMKELNVFCHNAPDAIRELHGFRASLSIDVQRVIEILGEKGYSVKLATVLFDLHTKKTN